MAGLSTYGYKIMRVLGVKAVKVTNARGFCLELSTAITVVIASRYGTSPPRMHAFTLSALLLASQLWLWISDADHNLLPS